jgi:signal transduction histidine kinase/CheY-like chemotaxis protein
VRLAGDEVEVYDATSSLTHHFVKALLLTKTRDGGDALLVGTNGGGISILKNGRWSHVTEADGLPNGHVQGMRVATDSDGRRTLWVGTQSGGAAYRSLDDRKATWRVLSDETTPALPNNTVYRIEQDHRGRIYLFTNKGVVRLTPRTPTDDDPAEFTVYTFTSDDGLPSNECNAGASLVDSLGRVWVGTVGGAAVFDPHHEVEDCTPKPLHISRVRVRGELRRDVDGTTLRHDENDVAFDFDLLSYFRESDTRYRTQLVGYDDAPSEWTDEYRRVYTNLPAGRYTFRVWGRDYAGNVSGPVEVPFRVANAPWRTWWAYLGYTAIAAGATYGGVRWRINALNRRNEELELRIREQTAELAENVERLKISEAVSTEKAEELALAVEQLRVLERNAQRARADAVEAKDRALEASRAKSEFLSNMSHELRTPLNAVLGFAQLMERDQYLTGDQREHLTAITTSGEHLLHLINDVLSLSKIEAGKLTLAVQPFDVHHMLEGVEAMFRGRVRTRKLGLVFERDASLPRMVHGDEGKIRQILINLIGNAVKFTNGGGVTVRAAWQAGIGYFEVRDTGHGIAEDEISGLFEPFVQTESGRKAKEGTGLGLAIVRNFVELMGGDIRVESRVGVGTTFSFEIELEEVGEGEAGAERLRVAELEPGQPEYRILVVDDAARNRELLDKLLGQVGFQVSEAADGRQALALWASWRPHLILMDIRMPVMDGLTATREIRRLEREIAASDHAMRLYDVDTAARTVIISLTASAFEHERDQILAAGCDDFVTKPFRESTLFERIAQHLGVRFRYIQPGVAAAEDLGRVAPEALAPVDRELLARLADAVLKGDLGLANDAIDAIERTDGEVARALRLLIRDYRFDEIQDLLDAAAGG